jgi:hypothetical protein
MSRFPICRPRRPRRGALVLALAVIEACDRGLELSPGDSGLLAGRGLVRALTGDLAGARADLEAAQAAGGSRDRERRQAWIEALGRGENPFTPELLESMRER